MSDEYIAGLLDGEGSISISRSVRKPSDRLQFALRLTITNTDSIIIQQLQEMFGGSVLTPPMEGKLGTKKVYVWGVNGPIAAEVLERLYPHLRIKKMEALEAMTFQRHQRTGSSRGGAPLTEEEVQERENAYWTLRELKHLSSDLEKDTRDVSEEPVIELGDGSQESTSCIKLCQCGVLPVHADHPGPRS